MDKVNFELFIENYKKSIDKIILSDEKIQELINKMKTEENKKH